MAKLETKILLEVLNDVITKYQNINDFIQRKLIAKCDGEGLSIDEVSLEHKTFSQTKHVTSQIQNILLLVCLRFPYALLREA